MICKACYGLKIKWQILWKIPKSPWLSSMKAAVAVSSVVKQGRFWGWGCCVSVQNSGIREVLRLLCVYVQSPRAQGGSGAQAVVFFPAEPQEAGPWLAGQHGWADHGAGAAGAAVQHARHRPGGHGGEGTAWSSEGRHCCCHSLSFTNCVCVCAQHGFGQKCQGEPLGLQHECEVKTKMKCCGHRLTMNSCSSAENVFYIFWCS